ncbi:MAG TPA: GNAT family N-acetyltransferase, partial [Solirubrobacteraceae bacterium]|nr:GNAT family N-acetyltransferase [Solirubrobacteraceae bacterium]
TPLVHVTGTWDAWLAGKSSNFRGRARRLERKLVREHALTFRLTERPEDVQADLDAVIRLHEARWAHDGVPTGAFAGARRAFHHDVARRALHNGSLRLWVAEVDECPIAAYYGFRAGGSEWYYQLGRDPAWNAASIGFVLLTHVLRSAFEDGLRCFRFGLGGEDYKDRFADADPGLHTAVLAAGIVNATTVAAARGLRRLPERARRPLLSRAG